MTEYAQRHLDFVSGLSGSTKNEVIIVTAVGPVVILLRNLGVPWLFPTRMFKAYKRGDVCLRLVLDIALTVLPIQCAYTFPSHMSLLLGTIMLMIIAIVFFCFCEYIYSDRIRPSLAEVRRFVSPSAQPELIFISYFRAYVNIATALCILAVDFPVFPRRFAKTETYGYSVMDSGVGAFVVANGLVFSKTKVPSLHRSFRSHIKSLLPLIGLGCLRLGIVKLAGYHEHVTEYGVHWNFFFTLAAIKTLALCLHSCRVRCHGCLGLVLAVVYQCLLSKFGLREFLLYGSKSSLSQEVNLDSTDDDRHHFLSANREGLVSLLGYFALFLLSSRLGQTIFSFGKTIDDKLRLCLSLVLTSFLCFALVIACEAFIEPASRRFVNLTYILWIIFLALEQLVGFLIVEIVVTALAAFRFPLFTWGGEDLHSPFDLLEPCLWRATNYNSLAYFLLANLLTGLVNVTLPTIDVSNSYASLIIFVYMLVLSVVIFRLFVRKCQVKI